jgi:hypothetical protein
MVASRLPEIVGASIDILQKIPESPGFFVTTVSNFLNRITLLTLNLPSWAGAS